MVAYNFEVLGEEEQDDVVKSVSEPAKLYNFEVLGEDEDLDKPVSELAKLDNFETFGPDDPEIATREAVNSLPSAETINDLMTDKNFSVVGQYMEQRFGMQESRHGRQKIIDSYVNHMRKFNFGQTVTTGTELAYLNTDNETKKIAAGQA